MMIWETGVSRNSRKKIQFVTYWISESESRSVMSNSLKPHGLYSPQNSPSQNTRVSCYALFQGIFPTQGLNPGHLHFGQILYQQSQQGSPGYLERHISFHYNCTLFGKGNGIPLQYSCYRIPWTGEPGGLWSMGLQRVAHDWVHSTHLI